MHYRVLTNRTKIVIVDYKDTLNRDLKMEIDILKEMIPDCKVVILEYEDTKQKKEELIHELKDADAVKTAFVMLDRSILSECRHLKCISFNSTGFNNVDKKYAKDCGIAIMNVPEYCTDEVADHTIMLMLSLNKNLKVYDNMVMEKHRWTYRLPMGSHSLSEQTLGIIGFGKIGRAVAKKAKVFGMRVLVSSNHVGKDEQQKYGVEYASMEEIQKYADIISIHTKESVRKLHEISTRNIAYYLLGQKEKVYDFVQ